MKIQELWKQATPLPLHLNSDQTWIDGAALEPVATTAHGDIAFETQKANAKLLTHSTNMLPKALEVLERVASMQRGAMQAHIEKPFTPHPMNHKINADCDCRSCTMALVKSAIAEIETIN